MKLQTKSPSARIHAQGFVKSGKITPILPQKPLYAKPILLCHADRCFAGADLARKRGDVARAWQLRRRGLLYQARWYAATHHTASVSRETSRKDRYGQLLTTRP